MIIDLIIGLLPKNIAIKLSQFFFGKLDYCFLIHSRYYSDLYRKFPYFKILPNFILRSIGRYMWPLRVGYIYGLDFNNKKKNGLFIGSPMDAKDMLDNRDLAKTKILKAANFAEKLGVKYIGLGALSASLTRNGLDVKEKINCFVTTGHSLTAWVVSDNAIRIKKILNRDLTIAIVGAGGSIGSACYYILKRHFKKIILIEKNLERLRERVNLSDQNIKKYSQNLEDIKLADIIITATNAPYSIIDNINQLKKGTILIDDAQPINVSRKVNSQEYKTLVIEGGVCNLNGINYKLNLDLLDTGDMFSCMGELLVLTALDSNDVTVGFTNEKRVLEISKMAELVGIHSARFRSFGKLVTDDYIKYILS
ncbi:MAG: hypothetical protein WCS88_04190 [Patescibacteria group bacterium]|jgi:predicted amino acid dehydrogenase